MKLDDKVLALLLLGWFSGARVAAGQDAAADWSGNFEGYMQGSCTVFSIEQQEDRIAGKIVDDNGYTYTIEAVVEGARAK